MKRSLLTSLGLVVLAVFIWSAISPHDRFTWFLEVLPVLLVVPLLFATGKRFPLTPLLYVLIAVHAVILMIGGHYTYAEVPLFNWIRDEFGFARNHYDRVGHFAQGFIPAIAARELLLRHTPLRRGGWLFTLVVCSCLALSAMYELFEWSTAVFSGEAADAFLGTQGDVWDTQKDMALAFVGSIVAQLLLSRVHDRQVEGLVK